jgi:hypothetical protein
MGIFSVAERFLPPAVVDNFFLTIYSPFFFLIVGLGNLKREATMIEAPILAILIGSVFYSVVLGFIFYFYKLYRNDARAEKG